MTVWSVLLIETIGIQQYYYNILRSDFFQKEPYKEFVPDILLIRHFVFTMAVILICQSTIIVCTTELVSITLMSITSNMQIHVSFV